MHSMYSGINISQTDARPMYQQIMEQIRARIAVGDWAAGKELPSIRALAAALSVSVITIKRAYLELELEGVIVTRQGKGSFVAEGAALTPGLRTAEVDEHLKSALRAAKSIGMDVEGPFSQDEARDRLNHLKKATRVELEDEDRRKQEN